MDANETDTPAEELRAKLLERFERWLDVALAGEAPPEGLEAEILAQIEAEERPEEAGEQADLHALWSAMTTLSQEVKLQGRSFKQLSDSIAPLTPLLESAAAEQRQALEMTRRVTDAAAEGRREEVRSAEHRAQRALLEVLLDMRERLGRGLAPAREYLRQPPNGHDAGWLARLLGVPGAPDEAARAAVAALEEGCRLCLERLEETLGRMGVLEIQCANRPFDPHTMTALEVVETRDPAADGTVLAVHRPGYTWSGELLRPAQVRVARSKAG